ncbi:MAG: NnrS family protein [Thiomargarita sp.]|nr:NnrS family protein [Thiomargarita sp.]
MPEIFMQIEKPQNVGRFGLLHLGFRPFFIGASSFAVLSISIWMLLLFQGKFSAINTYFTPMAWHAHEMIFGYTMAVIAGFLLTATKNWTNIPTVHGYPLLFLFLLWLVARILPFLGGFVPLIAIAIIDNLFIFCLIATISIPLFKAKHWKSFFLVSHIILLLLSNIIFYLGIFDIIPQGVHYGLYLGLYLILSLVIIMGRRVIPSFVERATNLPLKNWSWVDNSHLIVFWAFALADLMNLNNYLVASLAGLTVLVHGTRLIGWHTIEIWKKPLLWILYLAYIFIVVGFLLKILTIIYPISPFLSIHAFAVGGISMITIGMMARVSLGHTGRSVLEPPWALFWIFILLGASTIIRVIFPIIFASLYLYWIAISQVLWIIAFSWFLIVYFPILLYPRIDGRYG